MPSALAPASRALGVALVVLVGVVAWLGGCSALIDWTSFSNGLPADGGDDGGSDDADAESPGTDGAPESSLSDGMPACGPATCGGCCSAAGSCAGGQSVGTCGTSGAACTDCSPGGQVCRAGKCATRVPDAAPPAPCSPSACPVCGALVYTASCCKPSDGTCGCQVVIPNKGPCM